MSASGSDPRLTVARRSVRDSRPAPRAADATASYHDQGLEALATGNYARAEQCFDAVVAPDPDNPRFQAYRAWARYMRLASGELNVPKSERQWLEAQRKANAREIIEKATKRLPRFDAGYYFLARIAYDAGDLERADALARRALVINAGLDEAERLVDRVAKARAPEPRAGVFERFGKWLSGKREATSVSPLAAE